MVSSYEPDNKLSGSLWSYAIFQCAEQLYISEEGMYYV
jgi:hypothetical protein